MSPHRKARCSVDCATHESFAMQGLGLHSRPYVFLFLSASHCVSTAASSPSASPRAASPAEVPAWLVWTAHALTLLLILLLAWQIAGRLWAWFAPEPARTLSQAAANTSANDWERARRLFGDEAGSGPAAANTSGIRLRGVYAVDGQTLSAAVVNNGGKRDLAVRIGEEIEKGVTLAVVEADYIEISRNGARERIEIDRRIIAPRPGTGGPASARGFRLNVASTGPNAYSLSRSELNTTLQDPNQLAFTGRISSGNGGVRIDSAPAGSLPQKLGLAEGDVIRSLNGQPVSSIGDLARLYGQFGNLSAVRADVSRGGQNLSLTLQITP
jgi:general secretion pathway protein C